MTVSEAVSAIGAIPIRTVAEVLGRSQATAKTQQGYWSGVRKRLQRDPVTLVPGWDSGAAKKIIAERVEYLRIVRPAPCPIPEQANRPVVLLDLQIRIHQIEVHRLELGGADTHLLPFRGGGGELPQRVF